MADIIHYVWSAIFFNPREHFSGDHPYLIIRITMKSTKVGKHDNDIRVVHLL